MRLPSVSIVAVALGFVLGGGPDPHWDDEIAGGTRPPEVDEEKAAVQAQGLARLLCSDAAPAKRPILFGDLHVHSSYS